MRIPRVYLPVSLKTGDIVSLDSRAHHHLITVLRLSENDPVTVFNGSGGEYTGTLTLVSRKSSSVTVHEFHSVNRESSFQIRLLQGISKNEHMDHTLQKAVELGVDSIIPVITERTSGRLTGQRLEKKLHHWQGVLISACEQCGRTIVPVLEQPLSVNDIPNVREKDCGIVLYPNIRTTVKQLKPETNRIFSIVVGAEGGLTDIELKILKEKDYLPVGLGPRILRTETAGIAVVAISQMIWGDLG